MARDTLTIEMHGDVSLGDFATTMQRCTELVQALSTEIAKDVAVTWTVDELRAGSATTTVRGTSPQPDLVERTVRAYASVSAALAEGAPIPSSDAVTRRAQALTLPFKAL